MNPEVLYSPNVDEWCNCQAVPGTSAWPGPWHPVGNEGGVCDRRSEMVPQKAHDCVRDSCSIQIDPCGGCCGCLGGCVYDGPEPDEAIR